MPKPVGLVNFFEDDYLIVREPKLALAPGAIEIVLKKDTARYHERSYKKIFSVYQSLKHYWTQGSENGKPLTLGHFYVERRDAQSKSVCRQIIPYTSGGYASTLRQVQVAWNLMFPKAAWTKRELLGNEASIRKALNETTRIEPTTDQPAADPFCRKEREQAQLIVQGKLVNLWYNFRELTPGDLLLISKEHTKYFREDAFVEAMCNGRKIHAERAKQGQPIGYLTFSDHPAAGQTVPHAHIHVTNASSALEELGGVAKALRKIFIDSWAEMVVPSLFRYSDKQLVPKIAEQRKLLQHIFC